MLTTEGKTERFRGWILGIINGIDTEMLKKMIVNNEMPLLWEYKLPTYMNFIKGLIAEYKEQILEQLTFDIVMSYAKEYRPDLARIIIHPKGKQWMTRFLKMIAFLIKHSDLDNYEIAALYQERMLEIKKKRESNHRAEQKLNEIEQERIQAEAMRMEQERIYYENAKIIQERTQEENAKLERLRAREELREEFRLRKEEARLERMKAKKLETQESVEVEEKPIEEENIEPLEPEDIIASEEGNITTDTLDVDTTVDMKNKYDFL